MNKRKVSTKYLVLGGILSAASIVLTRMLGFMIMGGTARIAFGNVPIALAGILMGPMMGALVGIVSDVLGIMLVSHGTPFLGFTLSSALQGVIPALIVHKSFTDKSVPISTVYMRIIVATIASTVIVSFILNTLWLTMLRGSVFTAVFVERLLPSTLIGVISAVLLVLLAKAVRNHSKLS